MHANEMEMETETRQHSADRYARPIGHILKFYLCGHVQSPKEYMDWFEAIRTAGPNDAVIIYINSMGGDLLTAIQLMRAMKESSATVVASVEGACMSAATLIFLSAHHKEVADHSTFMFHNYSAVMGGKGGELHDQVVHDRQWTNEILRAVYTGFLTDEEIASIIANKDIWMSAVEVRDRLLKLYEAEQVVETPVVAVTKKRAKKSTKKRTTK